MTRGPDKQFDQERVLEKAMDLFWAQGFEGTSLNELLEVMGIGRQSLYDTFGDKKSLFLQALERYLQQRMAVMDEVLHRPGSPLRQLRTVFEKMAEMSRRPGSPGCFMGNCLAEFGSKDPDVRRVLEGAFDRMEAGFAGVLSRAQKAGEIAPDAPVEDLARVLVVTAQGMALMSRISSERKLLESIMATIQSTLGVV